MKSTTKVIISFSFPIEHLSVFYLLVTESEERLVFSEMLNILDCLQKLSVTVRKVRGKNRLSSVVKSSENSRNYSNKSSCVINNILGGDIPRGCHTFYALCPLLLPPAAAFPRLYSRHIFIIVKN